MATRKSVERPRARGKGQPQVFSVENNNVEVIPPNFGNGGKVAQFGGGQAAAKASVLGGVLELGNNILSTINSMYTARQRTLQEKERTAQVRASAQAQIRAQEEETKRFSQQQVTERERIQLQFQQELLEIKADVYKHQQSLQKDFEVAQMNHQVTMAALEEGKRNLQFYRTVHDRLWEQITTERSHGIPVSLLFEQLREVERAISALSLAAFEIDAD